MTMDSTSASSSKAHADPSADASDREARVGVRRQRIDARTASKDDASRKKQLQVGDSQRMSRGQQQVADSLNQLDRRKLAGIRHVTSVRVEADDAENRRRVEEEERRHRRVQKLQQEAVDSGAKNAAVEMRWADLFEFSMPQELHNELELQNRACADILASKDAVIREFQTQLKAKDEEYVTVLKVQAEEVEKLVDRMSQQYREMQNEYELELEQMEDAFLKERDELIANNKLEIDSLFERRREMEMVYMEAKQTRDEQYLQGIEELRVRDAEDYNELKIKLETNIQTLEQQLEEMRATYQLNTEKLEYNYRVLTERDMENSATLSQQKRKLARLKDALATLIAKYNQTDARDRHQNEELTEEYRRLTKQYRDLQRKYAHFEASDSNKFDEVWQMHEENAIHKIEKLLDADRIIHEQQLGLTWRPPAQSIRNWSHSAKAGDAASLQKQLENGDESSPDSTESEKGGSRRDDNGGNADQDDFDDESVEAYTPPVKKISGAKLKYMLKMLASEAGFLVNGSVQQALENLPDDEAQLVKADMIMRALGIDNEEDMEKLMGYFFEDPRQEVPVGGDNNRESNSPGKDGKDGAKTSWGLVVGPEDVIRVIKRFVEETNEQKRAAPAARILHRSVSGETEGGKKTTKGSSSAALKAKARKVEKEYWANIVKVFPAQKIRVMATLEKGLTHYNTALLRRKELIDEVTGMKAQNAELKNLLKQYLAAPINEDLIVPPTQMQLYQ
ncbi:Dynein regulatory complex protein 1 [Phytophthora fragariae]|uniref:Dynein regulatory complex protein 1 n=1 Tax=Phytophthora fragariae TaxID=53985 RepID=A0A6G0NQ70_9STRA|nr:Dynein regulatory complex protein 1 [Phytophthora fragariae]